MASASSKTAPKLSEYKHYKDWVRITKIWVNLSNLDNTKKGPAIVMSLEGKALESVFELSDDEISAADGPSKIIAKLDTIYKRDELTQKFDDLEAYENYKRSSDTNIQDFIAEFDRRYAAIKKQGVTISDDLLGFKLLKAANLSSQNEQLIKATSTEIKYDTIKTKIKSTFSGDNVKPDQNPCGRNMGLCCPRHRCHQQCIMWQKVAR